MEKRIKTAFICFGEINTAIERLRIKHDEALMKIREFEDVESLDCGIVIDDPEYKTGDEALAKLHGQNFSSVIACIAGWVPSHAVLYVIDQYRHIPIMLWGLCGWIESGKIITTADQAGTSALRPTLEELGFKFRFIYNRIGKPYPMQRIHDYLRACATVYELRFQKIGSMGYRDMLLYSTAYDAAAVRRVFGVEVENFEMLEMVQNCEKQNDLEIINLYNYIKKNWLILKDCKESVIKDGIRYALAIGKKIGERGYAAVTLNDVDGMKKLLGFPPAMVFMLLEHLYGVETTPENDVMGNLTQLLMRGLSGATAHYMEYYEYFDDGMLIGVPDYIPEPVVEDKVQMLPAAFGLLNSSLLNVSKVKGGYVTCVRLAMKRGDFVIHVYTGEAKQPPSWEEFGWDKPAPQLSSLRIYPDSCSVEHFAENVLSQHVIVSYGNHLMALKDLCYLLDITLIQ